MKILYLALLFPVVVQSAFEAIDCGQDGIFENPSYISNRGIQTLWVQSFGILPYARISYSGVWHNLGVGISNFGNELYRENEFLLGYAWLTNLTTLGASIRGMSLCVKDRSPNFTVGVDFGINFKASPILEFSLALHNLNFPKVYGDELPKRVIGGVIVNLTPNFTTYLQIYKESIYRVEMRIRNEIRLSELMSLGTGIKTYPVSFTFGFLLNYKRSSFSYFVRTHETLGVTHILGLNIKQ